ncbi:hypothetical protein BDC45DRAFT_533909 [Circinella umbellata]|nr:hypothetical protein BDC45DRAFT_533909 [Circinella umbellata]
MFNQQEQVSSPNFTEISEDLNSLKKDFICSSPQPSALLLLFLSPSNPASTLPESFLVPKSRLKAAVVLQALIDTDSSLNKCIIKSVIKDKEAEVKRWLDRLYPSPLNITKIKKRKSDEITEDDAEEYCDKYQRTRGGEKERTYDYEERMKFIEKFEKDRAKGGKMMSWVLYLQEGREELNWDYKNPNSLRAAFAKYGKKRQ